MRQMKILGLACSPRIQSNTTALLEQALKGANDSGARVETIAAGKANIKPCIHCDYCEDNRGCCPISDDMKSLYPKLVEADGIILSAPIYFMGLCAQAKCLIDRCQVFYTAKYRIKQPLIDPARKRLAALIAVGGTGGSSLFPGSKTVMRWWLDSLSADYWNNLLIERIDHPNEIQQHPHHLQTAYQMGQDMVKTWQQTQE